MVLHRPSPVVLHRAQTELGVVHASGRDVEEKGVIAEFARVKRIRHGDSLLLFALSLRFRILLLLGLGPAVAVAAKLVVAVALVAVVVGPLRLRPASTPGHDAVPRLLRLLDEGIVLLALGRHRGVQPRGDRHQVLALGGVGDLRLEDGGHRPVRLDLLRNLRKARRVQLRLVPQRGAHRGRRPDGLDELRAPRHALVRGAPARALVQPVRVLARPSQAVQLGPGVEELPHPVLHQVQ